MEQQIGLKQQLLGPLACESKRLFHLSNCYLTIDSFCLRDLSNQQKAAKTEIYRVVHPEMIDTVRTVIPILPKLPSVNAKRISNQKSFETASFAYDTNISIY